MAHASDEVLGEFLGEVQARNLFEKIAVTSTGCLGPCGQGPSVLVYPEGVMYGPVGKGDVREILEQHLLGGTPVERLKVPPGVWG
jgi:(2Fe-2S) ferredoxin